MMTISTSARTSARTLIAFLWASRIRPSWTATLDFLTLRTRPWARRLIRKSGVGSLFFLPFRFDIEVPEEREGNLLHRREGLGVDCGAGRAVARHHAVVHPLEFAHHLPRLKQMPQLAGREEIADRERKSEGLFGSWRRD